MGVYWKGQTYELYLKRDPKQTEPARPSLPCASSKNYHERKTPQHPPLVGDLLEYYLFWILVVGRTICFCVRSRGVGCLQRHVFLTACLCGGQPADREERSDEFDHLCFGLESLIQLLTYFSGNKISFCLSFFICFCISEILGSGHPQNAPE